MTRQEVRVFIVGKEGQQFSAKHGRDQVENVRNQSE